MTMDNEQATTADRSVASSGLARAILSLHPGAITAVYAAMSVSSVLLTPGSAASIVLGLVFASMLGGWWWALLSTVTHLRPAPGRRWPWLFLLPVSWAPVQWLAERWLGRMDGELSTAQILFKLISMIMVGAFFYGFWRLASTFEEAEGGEKAKSEQVLATMIQIILVFVGVWTLRAKIRRLLLLAA